MGTDSDYACWRQWHDFLSRPRGVGQHSTKWISGPESV